MKCRILIVEDEDAKREVLADLLQGEGFEVTAVPDAILGLASFERAGFDIVLTDLRMPDMDGLAFLKELRRRAPDVPVLIMTAYGSIPSTVEAVKAGAFDYIAKPFTLDELKASLARALSAKAPRAGRPAGEEPEDRFGSVVGDSPSMRKVFSILHTIADSSSTVLLYGESGTGKNLVARAVHDASSRRQGPFVAMSCAALSADLLVSELFGHEAGAFTGALKAKRGRFELADGGTIFLDDVDDIPLDMQVKLLNVLQERSFERVGGERTVKVDVRAICATKRPLKELVEQGSFREDLYYRISVVPVELPPLRERKEDIGRLAAHFLGKLCAERNRPVPEISKAVTEILLRHDWPGNVRELENAVEYAVNFHKDGPLLPAHLPPYLAEANPGVALDPALTRSESGFDLADLLARYEMGILRWAYGKTKGNCSLMARFLNVPRSTLRDKLKKYGFPGDRSDACREGEDAD